MRRIVNGVRRPFALIILAVVIGGVGAAWAAQVPTTIDDFFIPGTQPVEVGQQFDQLLPSVWCQACHPPGAPEVPIFNRWEGSMMAHAARDPLFLAAMTIANQDALDAGDLCIRCHAPLGWISGRSTPTDGSALTDDDRDSVTCNFCHRMVDPVFKPAVSPVVDQQILDDLSSNGLLPVSVHSGAYVLDPQDRRRGPFDIVADLGIEPHPKPTQISPFHTSSDLCATCHDVSNPVYEITGTGNYVLGAVGFEHSTGDKRDMFPVERTYSEWPASAFAVAPIDMGGRFGGNDPLVSTCQDCHMPKSDDLGCTFADPRPNMPNHDFSGAATWQLQAVANLYPTATDPIAIQDGINRSISMLQRAATLQVSQAGCFLDVRVINETGHKLPTGYPEGRRMWINVQFQDAAAQIVRERGRYNSLSAYLNTADTRVYETKIGIDADIAAATGVPEGVSFHFALNNVVYKDNRIPPRGFTNAGFAAAQASPVGKNYADGQYWDDARYFVPSDAIQATITLYYQASSREYIEFLRDENVTDSRGTTLYNQWVATGKSAPVAMATQMIAFAAHPGGDFDGNGEVDLIDYISFPSCMTGPDIAAAALCLAFDCDDDGDVDAYDYGAFTLALTEGATGRTSDIWPIE